MTVRLLNEVNKLSMNIFLVPYMFAVTLLFQGCQMQTKEKGEGGKDKQTQSQPQIGDQIPYNLSDRVTYALPPILDEISGLTFVGGNADVVYTIQDESGIVYVYDLKNRRMDHEIPFAGKGDFEDIANDGKQLYVLKSNGAVYSLPIDKKHRANATKVYEGLLPKGEYESLAYNSMLNELYVLCKSCKVDQKKGQATGYRLTVNTDGTLTYRNEFIVDLSQATTVDEKQRRKFSPSAMTWRASTNEWYIISSVDKLMLITDADFNPKEVVRFSRKDYEQPEGLAFDGADNLYISSEAGDTGQGVIYQLKPTK